MRSVRYENLLYSLSYGKTSQRIFFLKFSIMSIITKKTFSQLTAKLVILFNLISIILGRKLVFKQSNCPAVAPAFAVPALPGEFPYMFIIGWEIKGNNTEKKYEYKCGAAMLRERYLLTAAHCFYDSDEQPVVVTYAGSDNINDPSVTYNIEDVIEHPGYQYPYAYNDIALIKLLPNKRDQFAFLPTFDPVWNETVTIVGYGSEKFAGPPAEKLLKTDVQIISNEECSQYYKPDGTSSLQRDGIIKTQVCARDTIDNKRDACQGDSGGPIVRRHLGIHYIVGITSFGIGCGNGPPGVYTRVSEYREWIESVMRPWYNEESAFLGYFYWLNSKTCEREPKECGGVMISWNYMVLAAHCLLEKNEFPYLYLNNGYNRQYGQGLSIVNAEVHDDYKYPLPYHDIGLIRTSFISYFVTPIWLQFNLPNHTFTAYNLENTTMEQRARQDLLKTTLTYVPKEKCQMYYEHFPENFTKGITDEFICAEDKEQLWDMGQGYSEGPLIMHIVENNISTPYLVGIASIGVNCKYCPPGVYARLYSDIDWINKIVWPKPEDVIMD